MCDDLADNGAEWRGETDPLVGGDPVVAADTLRNDRVGDGYVQAIDALDAHIRIRSSR